MIFKSIEILRYKNISKINIKPERINFIVGENGSGKTSLLDAFYYCAHGKSFISSDVRHQIQYNESDFNLITKIKNNNNELKVAYNKNTKIKKIKINNKNIQRQSDITKHIPLKTLHPNSILLINGQESHRRDFVNWGLFHMKHSFNDIWSKYLQTLKQRNNSLKTKEISLIQVWDNKLSFLSQEIDNLRLEYIEILTQTIQQYTQKFFVKEVSIVYYRGWRQGVELLENLKKEINNDIKKGWTGVGPHKFSLKIMHNNNECRYNFSRGQQKILSYCLVLAQIKLLEVVTGKISVLLIDDILSELDQKNTMTILKIIKKLNNQVFLSSISYTKELKSVKNHKMFHMKQGSIII
ncbi:MAG: hypothetical protein DRQ51_03980 [Gammaproteobacteria bacterium]|nr:MAG: hypothetical protein DRQ51_03980 [Gammaproteobacteria bacterium]